MRIGIISNAFEFVIYFFCGLVGLVAEPLSDISAYLTFVVVVFPTVYCQKNKNWEPPYAATFKRPDTFVLLGWKKKKKTRSIDEHETEMSRSIREEIQSILQHIDGRVLS